MTRIRYGLPSPLAQKAMAFLVERLTAAMVSGPGENIAPAHGSAVPEAMSPLTFSARFEPSAPSSTTVISAFDPPPAPAPVEIDQPAPKRAPVVPSSKSLT